MNEAINAGDLVQLRSGGPRMTAGHLDAIGERPCSWVNPQTGAVESHRFQDVMLVKVDAGQLPFA